MTNEQYFDAALRRFELLESQLDFSVDANITNDQEVGNKWYDLLKDFTNLNDDDAFDSLYESEYCEDVDYYDILDTLENIRILDRLDEMEIEVV